MDEWRARGQIPGPAQIAQAAVDSGLSPHEGVVALCDGDSIIGFRPHSAFDAVSAFVAHYLRQQGGDKFLEYAASPALVTAQLLTEPAGEFIDYVVRNQGLVEALTQLFRGKAASVHRDGAESSLASPYDAIVCSPPIGQRAQNDRLADGFGGETVRRLLPLLSDKGSLLWITARGVFTNSRAKQTIRELDDGGLHVGATLDVAPGAFPNTAIPGVVLFLSRSVQPKRFVGGLREPETAEGVAAALAAGPSRKSGQDWAWLEPTDLRTFVQLQYDRLTQKLTPRGRHEFHDLASLCVSDNVVKADRAAQQEDVAASFLFIPEYANGRVTATLEEQTVKANAVWRFIIEPSKANTRFLAQLLNSPYGRHIRAAAATGTTIQRCSLQSLLALDLPLPDLKTQERIAGAESDVRLLRASLADMMETLDRSWSELDDVVGKVNRLKSVLDIERQIEDWWRELPYPMAAIYRRYRVSTDPREKLDALYHFFEMSAVFLAAVGTSHVRALRPDWTSVMARWVRPERANGIERTDFGFWVNLARVSLKDTSRIGSDAELREAAIEIAGPEPVQVAGYIGQLGNAIETLDNARRSRNSWKGHGGLVKPGDAANIDASLQPLIRGFYEVTASVFRRFHLVRPGRAYITDTGMTFEVEKLTGSDPTFAREQVELDRPIKSGALAFWMDGARTMCHALPFFRLGAPQAPLETSFYVFNRVENGNLRWVCYQEAREQEIIASDEELSDIISLREGTP
jgi:hypothetical protein